MIFVKLFLVFAKIGIFNFGGGYAALSLIQNEVVEKHNWMTSGEFTDIVAISQMTPGPIGINCATYAGYTASMNYFQDGNIIFGIIGSFVATFSLILLPFILMLFISNFLLKHKENQIVNDIFSALRPAIVGLIIAASILLLNEENFGSFNNNIKQFAISIFLFIAVFIASRRYKINPILLICISGFIGYIVYHAI